jgi:hypothetical protein
MHFRGSFGEPQDRLFRRKERAFRMTARLEGEIAADPTKSK